MEVLQRRMFDDAHGFAKSDHLVRMHSQRHQRNTKKPLSRLDLRVFFIRVSKCVMDDLIPEYLILNHLPLDRDTLLEVNGVRTSIYSDGVSTLLRRDRLDKKAGEVTFVSTDTVSTTGSVKYEVFDKDVLVLSGALELCNSNGRSWSMNCEPDKFGNQCTNLETASAAVEVFVAGCFLGFPVILTKTLQLGHRRKQLRKAMLESIPEYEATKNLKSSSPGHEAVQVADYPSYESEKENSRNLYPGIGYLQEDEDGELSWFNAGVRVGVGIGLSVCLGVGIGVGLLVKTYQGTATNIKRRLF